MSRVPAVRFTGFTDPWEQRKFGDLYRVVSEKNDLTFGTDQVISVANMYFNPSVYVTEDDYLLTYNVMRLGDIAFEGNRSKNYAHGRFVENTIGDGIVSHVFKVFRPIADYDLLYWKYAINNEGIMRDVLTRSTKASTMMHELVSSDFLEETTLVPTVAEQCKIGELFDRLDNLITLHRRKCEQLQVLKKALLEKMFPRDGETMPELRFTGFTDPWEQRKLGELLFFQNGFNGSSGSFGDGAPLISVMDILGDGFITHETVRGKARLSDEERKRFSVEYGDVLFQRSSENYEDAGTSNVYLDQLVPASFGGFVIRGKRIAGYDPIFIKYLLSSRSVRSQITRRAQGAQHVNVSQDTLADVLVHMPEMCEQGAVGSALLNLDNLITLHRRKLELLENVKRSLFDKMFA